MAYFYIFFSLIVFSSYNAQETNPITETNRTINGDVAVNEDRTQFTFTFAGTDIQNLAEGNFVFEISKDNGDVFTVPDYTFTLTYSKNVTADTTLYGGVINSGFELTTTQFSNVNEIAQIILSKDNGVISKVIDINKTNASIENKTLTFKGDVDLSKYSCGNYSIIYINQCGTKVETSSLWEIKPNDIKESSFDNNNNIEWEGDKALEITFTMQTRVTEDINMKIVFSDIENTRNKHEFVYGTSNAGNMTIDDGGKVIITVDKTNTAFLGAFEVSVEYPEIKESFPYKHK